MHQVLRHTPLEAQASERAARERASWEAHGDRRDSLPRKNSRQSSWDQESKLTRRRWSFHRHSHPPLIHPNPLSLWAPLGRGRVSKSLRCLLSFSLPFAKGSVENDIRKQATFLFTPLFFPAPNPVHPQRTLVALDAGAQRGLRKGRKRRIAWGSDSGQWQTGQGEKALILNINIKRHQY